MKWMCRVTCSALLAGLLATSQASAGVVEVTALPDDQTVWIDSFFDVYFEVDIPVETPVIGWGMDITWDESLATLDSYEIADPPWTEAENVPDEPGHLDLAGLVFPPPIWGDDILLVTLHFLAIDTGEMWVAGSHDEGDDTEGWPIYNTEPLEYADAAYTDAHVEIIPEPTTLALLGLGGLALIRRRR